MKMEQNGSHEILVLNKTEEKYLNLPYGGLFGNAAIVQIVEEMISDPFIEYRVKDLQDLLDLSPVSITNSLKTLVNLGLIMKEDQDPQRPLYKVNLKSKKFKALTILAYAINDDHNNSSLMDREIERYYAGLMGVKSYNQFGLTALTSNKNDFKRHSESITKVHTYSAALGVTA